ncbi:MAG: ATP-binding cassette domain-containing protein [Anaerolineae bacterium]|nr:ATP-binding cassette domain-containing protein [Anaerolineae bacterium]NUQ04360.1 ATP-binding cassette domain-containing protein [Anaerolineae bacterium]
MVTGEVHALLGENGAGKSTLIKIISGVHKPDSGEMHLDGKPVTFSNPREAQAGGIATIYQELSLYPELTVAENIFMGHAPRRQIGPVKVVNWSAMTSRAKEILASLNIHDLDVRRKVGSLSVGNRQRVEIAKALSINARVLIMDEPTAALTEADVIRLFEIVRLLRQRGVAIIYISHRLGEVFELADRVTVLRDGQYVGTSAVKDVTPDHLISMMVGRTIDNYITQGVNGILFAANDPVAIAPVLTRALESGIHVVGYDANSEPSAREWFVNQAEFNGIAKAMIDSMVAEIGADGSFAIVTSTFTTPNQARWIAEMQAYQGKCYPEMTWLETVEAQEDNVLSFNQATTLINKYGPDLDGIFGMTSVATPAAADAVAQAGLCAVDAVAGAAGSEEDAVAVVGLATPNAMKPYVTGDFAGCVKSVVLWNPIDLGYAAVYVLRAVVDGEFAPGDTSVMAGRLGELQVVNGSEVLLGPPFIYTAENIDDFDF